MQLIWREFAFAELSPDDIYDALRLRSAVFVVEQQCLYLDMDNKDVHARHLFGSANGVLIAYARLFAPGDYHPEAVIGRVVTAPAFRGQGLGKQLIQQAIASIEQRHGRVPIHIGAQSQHKKFYESFGFTRDGPDYLEGGIPHLPMLRPAS